LPAARRTPPLQGVRVLDLTRFIAGPYCTMLLADQGAEVVKVEPLGGEETRALEPVLGEVEHDRVSAYFLRYNRSKKSVCVDLKGEEGQRVFERLVRHADVLVENFRPGVLDRLGFGWQRLEALNERLVYCTITGFGHTESPLRDRGAFTPIVEASSASLVYRSRDRPPSISGYPVGDIFPAALATSAIAMALYRRERDGHGARIDMAMYDAMLSMNERAIGMSAMLDREWLPGIPADMGSAPTGVYRAADGYLTLAVVGEPMWQRFCAAIERPDWADDDRLGSGVGRAHLHDDVLQPGIEAWLTSRTRAEAVSILTEAGVPSAAAAQPLEVVDSEQVRARDMIVRYPTYGSVVATVVGNPMKFGGEERPPAGAAPAVGEHTTQVLRDWAGFTIGEIEALLAAGAVVQLGAAEFVRP
jgi:CoA:oxalate CoA-transferase